MKKILIAVLMAVSLQAPVLAKSGADVLADTGWAPPKKHGLAYKLTHAGITLKVTKVASSPLWVAGFGIAMVSGFVAIPVKRGIDYFCEHPFVSF